MKDCKKLSITGTNITFVINKDDIIKTNKMVYTGNHDITCTSDYLLDLINRINRNKQTI